MATGINNIGKAVVWSDTDTVLSSGSSNGGHSYTTFPSRRMTDLGLKHSEANGIND